MNKNIKTLNDFMPKKFKLSDDNSFIALAGVKNKYNLKKISISKVINVIEQIYDPEIPVNIYELGLIYEIKILKKNDIEIKMSLTSPGCPVAGEMPQQVADEVSKIKEVGFVKVELVWDPPWTVERMSDDARLALDFG